MEKKFNRVLSFFLALSLVLSFCVSISVPVSAAAPVSLWEYSPDPAPEYYFNSVYNALVVRFGASIADSVTQLFNAAVYNFPHGEVTKEVFDRWLFSYNSNFFKPLVPLLGLSSSFGAAEPREVPGLGIVRMFDTFTETWVTDLNGHFPFYYVDGDVPADMGANTIAPPSISRNKFIEVKNLDLTKAQLVVMTEDALAESVQLINDDGFSCTMAKASINGTWYWVIMRSGGTSAAYYCNSAGQPYVAIYEPSATNNQYDYIVGDNAVINDSQIIDLENGTLNLIDETGVKMELEIDSLLFDSGSKSYIVNAYTSNDDDYYTYYTYNITYNITNTYVTYIGSNDAYDREEYEYYYQLPDGRSSADLTADEIAGMSFEFHDVVNYARSATDVSVRGLYHFDGNTDDSSYFSTQGRFEWKHGASITYMEAAAAFDGALYLDNTAHSFDIVLPSNVGTSDFTLQFRYYQASQPDTVSNIDNSIQVGGTYVLCWDEKTVSRDPNGEYAAWALPVGTWNEVALVRNNEWLYVYLNGLCVSREPYSVFWNNTITFNFGSGSRAYSMLDELRILNFALVEGGASYTPTAVPFDSNLVLVLPDSSRPVADEYWDIKSSHVNLLKQYGLDDWFNGAAISHLTNTQFGANQLDSNAVYPKLAYRSQLMSLYTGALGTIFQKDYPTSEPPYYTADRFSTGSRLDYTSWPYGLTSVVYWFNENGRETFTSLRPGSTYTFSMVAADGSVGSCTFTVPSLNELVDCTSFKWFSSVVFNGYRIGLSMAGNFSSTVSKGVALAIVPTGRAGGEFIYLELVEGASTDLSAEFVTCIYPEDAVPPNTAAIQTTIPVNGYTVGGVRPTFPARGDVWFPVQDNRIQACYIYTGALWQEVGCRWYTGSRWIPIYAFDLTTLEDLFDIADAADAVVPITSESAFWRWWQLQWLDFREYLDSKFDALITAIKGGSPGSGDGLGIPDEDGNSAFSLMRLLELVTSSILEIATTVLTEFIGLIADLFKLFIQVVMDFIGGFVGVLSDAAGHIVTLGDRVTPISDFVRGIYDAIPDDIEAVLTGSFVLVVVVSVMSFLL